MNFFIIKNKELILTILLAILIYFISPIGVDWHKYYQLWLTHGLQLELRADIPQFNYYNFSPKYLSNYMGYNDFRILLGLIFLLSMSYLLRYSYKPICFVFILFLYLFYWGLDRQIISYLLLCTLFYLIDYKKSLYVKIIFLIIFGHLAIKIHTPSFLGLIYILIIMVINLSEKINLNFLYYKIINFVAILFLLIIFSALNIDIFYAQYLSQVENLYFNFTISYGIIMKLLLLFVFFLHFKSLNIIHKPDIYITFVFILVFIFAQILYPSILRIEFYSYFLPLYYLISKITRNNIYCVVEVIFILFWIFFKMYKWNLVIFNSPHFFINYIIFPFF